MIGRSFTVSEIAVVCSTRRINGKQKRKRHRETVADHLCQFLSGLCENAPHGCRSYSSEPNFAVLASFLHYADKNVLEREAAFGGAENVNAAGF